MRNEMRKFEFNKICKRWEQSRIEKSFGTKNEIIQNLKPLIQNEKKIVLDDHKKIVSNSNLYYWLSISQVLLILPSYFVHEYIID